MQHTDGASGRATVLGWALYDWANSAFTTTVMAGFFPLFFKQVWSSGTDPAVSTARLGMANSVAGLLVALAAPLLGAMADKGNARKRFLLGFAAVGIIMTACLAHTPHGAWRAAAALYVAASIGFAAANVMYDSLLPAVARGRSQDVVSALGYSLGYLGGGLLFAANVLMVRNPAMFGLPDMEAAVRVSFLLVAAWWAVFSLPLLLGVKEARAASVSMPAMARRGMHELAATFRRVRRLRHIWLFLLAYWLYIDGVDTIVRMAVDYGISLGFDSNDLILALLLTQFVGFPCALAFGHLGRRIGTRRAIFLGLAVYLVVCGWGAAIRTETEFFILAGLIGVVQGGVQALSRSFYARLIPADRPAEFFGFYNMVGKFAAVIGPALMGGVALAIRGAGFPSTTASRASIASVAILFVAGGALLTRVKEPGVPSAAGSAP
ncbi:MFS transporter [Candidatus Fermentibacteria bacterium]|nr:MFS transporter [Candidatus Fermentibacteria bacterium]